MLIFRAQKYRGGRIIKKKSDNCRWKKLKQNWERTNTRKPYKTQPKLTPFSNKSQKTTYFQ